MMLSKFTLSNQVDGSDCQTDVQPAESSVWTLVYSQV